MLKKIGFGLVAGLAATAVMDQGQTTLFPAVSSWINGLRGADAQDGSSAADSEEQPESAPEKVAHRVADYLDVSISRKRVHTLGNRIHWAYGTQWGVPYALLPVASGPLSGAIYGAALWLGSDELLLWALGLASSPTSYPLSTHIKALASHVIYGVTLGTLMRGLQSAMLPDND